MDPETLIKVVAFIDTRITQELRTHLECEYDYAHNQGYIEALREISNYCQSVIDADVAAMETSEGM
jgi:hypothetical protein